MDELIKQTFIPSSELVFTTVEDNRLHLLQAFRALSSHKTPKAGRQSKLLILDVSQVTQCDSAGLAFLIEAKRLARQYKKCLRIEGMPHKLLALAGFCGVQTLLETGV